MAYLFTNIKSHVNLNCYLGLEEFEGVKDVTKFVAQRPSFPQNSVVRR